MSTLQQSHNSALWPDDLESPHAEYAREIEQDRRREYPRDFADTPRGHVAVVLQRDYAERAKQAAPDAKDHVEPGAPLAWRLPRGSGLSPLAVSLCVRNAQVIAAALNYALCDCESLGMRVRPPSWAVAGSVFTDAEGLLLSAEWQRVHDSVMTDLAAIPTTDTIKNMNAANQQATFTEADELYREVYVLFILTALVHSRASSFVLEEYFNPVRRLNEAKRAYGLLRVLQYRDFLRDHGTAAYETALAKRQSTYQQKPEVKAARATRERARQQKPEVKAARATRERARRARAKA